jgi:hypothetical protein
MISPNNFLCNYYNFLYVVVFVSFLCVFFVFLLFVYFSSVSVMLLAYGCCDSRSRINPELK